MDDNFYYDGNGYGGNYEKRDGSSNYPWVYRNGYYSEKTRKSGIRPLHLVIVALLSSILGGGIVFTVFQFITPIVQPAVNSYFSRLVSTDSISGNTTEYVTTRVEYEIKETESPVVAVAEKVGPSIVGIKATARVQDFWFGSMETGGDGSGIIISEDGYILTNNHVIADVMDGDRGTKMLNGAKIEVTLAGDNSKTYPATVVGRDAKTDVAVLKINASGLTPAELGDSDSLKLGELAVAIGNPGGFTGSVTAGIISGLERSLEVGRQKYTLIQTDAAINPGNSGGALCNSKGQVIGINTVKITAVGFEGLGFAIPINDAKAIFEDLIEYNYVRGRPFLGISPDSRFTKDVADRNRVPEGVLVYEVVPLSGAYKAGVKVGDIITEFDGVRIKNYNELVDAITAHKPGDTVELKIYRNGETITLQATLEEDKG